MNEPKLCRPTFDELCKLEPALEQLRLDALRERDLKPKRGYYCATDVWVRQLKPRLSQLVGWYARHPGPIVRSSEAYDVAYDAVYALLPNCRGCGCIPIAALNRWWGRP